jgi:creatinine amidohydrolase
MRWELLNGHDFDQAVDASGGVCVLPLGSLERHGLHMPMGADYLNAHAVACLAAEQEPAVVFPGLYLGQVCESMARRGTIALRPELLVPLLRNVCDEIARNGFTKILVLNGHGGNWAWLQFMGFGDVREPRDYLVYYLNWWTADTDEQKRDTTADCEGRPYGHACEWETSVTMYLQGADSVDVRHVPDAVVPMLDRAEGLDRQVFTGINWFAGCPDCYLGDARHASLERGERYVRNNVAGVVERLRAIKADTALPALQAEYQRRCRSLGAGAPRPEDA